MFSLRQCRRQALWITTAAGFPVEDVFLCKLSNCLLRIKMCPSMDCLRAYSTLSRSRPSSICRSCSRRCASSSSWICRHNSAISESIGGAPIPAAPLLSPPPPATSMVNNALSHRSSRCCSVAVLAAATATREALKFLEHTHRCRSRA